MIGDCGQQFAVHWFRGVWLGSGVYIDPEKRCECGTVVWKDADHQPGVISSAQEVTAWRNSYQSIQVNGSGIQGHWAAYSASWGAS